MHFLLLLRLYNSLYRVLAFSADSFYLLLSWIRVFYFGTFSFCIYFLTLSSQRVFGLPIGLFEMALQECVALNILVSCILSIWPIHPNLCARMKFIIFLCFMFLSSSWLVFICQNALFSANCFFDFTYLFGFDFLIHYRLRIIEMQT